VTVIDEGIGPVVTALATAINPTILDIINMGSGESLHSVGFDR
jgi:hypothetical protein